MDKKVINHVIHEHNSGLSSISIALDLLTETLKNRHGEIFVDQIEQLKLIESGKKKCQEAIDYLYEEFKNEQS